MQEKKFKFNLAPFVLDIPFEDVRKYWFTSDFHLNHQRILQFTLRTDELKTTTPDKQLPEMRDLIVSNINESLGEDSILVNCGDVMLARLGDWEKELDRIRCDRQYILFGNHDYRNVLKKKNLNIGYDPSAKYQYSNTMIFRVWNRDELLHIFTVSHIPQDDFIGSFNVHGHLHSRPDLDSMKSSFRNYEICKKYRADGKHFDCGLDRNNYKPVSLEDILSGKTDIINL